MLHSTCVGSRSQRKCFHGARGACPGRRTRFAWQPIGGVWGWPRVRRYAYLDAQIFELMRHQDVLPIPNTGRIRRLSLPATGSRPGAVIACGLAPRTCIPGALWVAYDRPHSFNRGRSTLLEYAGLRGRPGGQQCPFVRQCRNWPPEVGGCA